MLTVNFIGNLGNKLFQLWSLIGIGNAAGNKVVIFPESEIYNYFEGPFHVEKIVRADWTLVSEKQFNYAPFNPPFPLTLMQGYFQSEKYWLPVEKECRKMFTFKRQFVKDTNAKMPDLFSKEVICLSVRRGNFVGNPVYYQLPGRYYIGALLTNFPDFEAKYNLLFLSDDLSYCKEYFSFLKNAYFADGMDAFEQLCIGSLAQYHIISNSTFSWWTAYLSKSKKVIRPKYNFNEAYRNTHPEDDFWPDTKNWEVFDLETYKIPETW